MNTWIYTTNIAHVTFGWRNLHLFHSFYEEKCVLEEVSSISKQNKTLIAFLLLKYFCCMVKVYFNYVLPYQYHTISLFVRDGNLSKIIIETKYLYAVVNINISCFQPMIVIVFLRVHFTLASFLYIGAAAWCLWILT